MSDEIPVVISVVSGAVALDTYLEPTGGAISKTTTLYADMADGYKRSYPKTIEALEAEFANCASDPKTASALARMADGLRMVADRIDKSLGRSS